MTPLAINSPAAQTTDRCTQFYGSKRKLLSDKMHFMEMENRKYIIKTARNKDGTIDFFLYGIALHVNNAFLCPNYIEKNLKPESFKYKYDWFDTYESGYFIKDKIKVSIDWSIYTDYSFTIDKYSTKKEIDKVKKWVTEIFEFLLKQEGVEITYINVSDFTQEEIKLLYKHTKIQRLFDRIKNCVQHVVTPTGADDADLNVFSNLV